MISYCIALLRPTYARLLIDDLAKKTSVPYEILVWFNTPDPSIRGFVQERIAAGVPIRVIGDTPENIGMSAFQPLFQNSQYELIVQLDDDVLWISRRIAETAMDYFRRHPAVRQLVSDVVQDQWTTGARPPLEGYQKIDEGLYNGPIDGWFSIYHRSVLPILMQAPYAKYTHLGHWMWGRLPQSGFHGFLCTKMKVFHVAGPEYSVYFGMRDFEVAKYRGVGRADLANWFAGGPVIPRDQMDRRIGEIKAELDGFGLSNGGAMRNTYVHAIRPTDIHQHLTFIYGLVVGMEAKKVLELGVNTGESTVAFLEALKVTGGRLTSVDIVPCLGARSMIDAYGLSDIWTFVQEDDLTFVKKWDKGQLDIIFIDTSHEQAQTEKEIEVYEPLVRPGGLLLFHDTMSYPGGVMQPLRAFIDAHPDYRLFNVEHCNGLGVVRKPVAPGVAVDAPLAMKC